MNKWTGKITALGLCAALCLSGVCVAFAQTTAVQEQPQGNQTEETENTLQEVSKDETVYVLAGADGNVQKVIVSDWIKNAIGSSKVSDKSDLNDIENVKGEENYTIDDNNMKVWDAQGNDIYYQGNIDKELPVGLNVSYQLDGKTITAQELAGQSGQVTIRFNYENRQYEMTDVNGKKEKIYVPFAILTGMIMDNDTFRNVEVSNGKLINDGDRTIVVGFAFPGLQENLALSRDKIDIPDYVEITTDVTDFEFGMTVTLATNEIFTELDAEKLDSANGAAGSIGELTTAMEQLLDGSSELYDGLCSLLNKSTELVSGVNQLADGAKNIYDGTASLDDGAAKLKSGLSELSSGLSTLSSNSSSLNSGAAQVFETLLSTATQQIQASGISISSLTISNYAEVLNGVISSLDETAVYNQALQQVTSAVEAKRPEITEQVTAAVREQVMKQVTAAVQEQVTSSVTAAVKEQVSAQIIEAAAQMSKADYDTAVAAGLISAEQQTAISTAITEQMSSDAVQTTIVSNVAAQLESDEIKATITANTDAQLQTENIQTTISQNIEQQVQQAISQNMASDAVQSQLAAASEGAKTIISLKASLDSYNSFYLGLCSYTGGVDTAASGAASLSSGASSLKDGTAQLKSGSSTLYNGVVTLKNGMPALIDGITQLRDGSMKLSEGLKEFNEQGVQKIVDLIDGDLDGIVERLKATIDVSKHYRNFAGICDDIDGQVKFIYRTDEIQTK